MFGRLLPQEGRFFDYFNNHAEQIVLGAQELAALMEDMGNAEKHIAAIEIIEEAADKITHETVAQARRHQGRARTNCPCSSTGRSGKRDIEQRRFSPPRLARFKGR